MTTLLSALTGANILTILSLVVLEALLSVDNALVLATMVSHLPQREQKVALRAGMVGAYVARALLLALASVIISTPWIKLVAGFYLFYLMSSHLARPEDDEENAHRAPITLSLLATIIQVEIMDIAFSVDNIAAAAAMSKHLWVVIAGVFIGIAAMRFVAQKLIAVVARFPILKSVAYVLVGWIGLQLWLEEVFHLQAGEIFKFATICSIVLLGLAYDRIRLLKLASTPVLNWIAQVLGKFVELVDSLLLPAKLLVRAITKACHRRPRSA